VLRPLARSLAIGIALQFDGAVVSPTKSDVERWPDDVDALFARAWSNLATSSSPVPERLDDPNGEVWGLFGGDYFLASHLLRLPSVLPCEAPHGYLAVVPHSRAIAAHPLGAPAPAVLERLVSFAQNSVAKAPRPLSAEVYWIGDGGVEAVTLGRDHDQLTLDGTPRFVDTASQLGWRCTAPDPLARASFETCTSLTDGMPGARLLQVVAPTAGAPLPFDPDLKVRATAYWIVATPDGRYVDAHGEMVFDTLHELVSALFTDTISLRPV
jgi:hypothetical protein